MHIALVLSSLELGGAQRVALALSEAWAKNGHEVSLLTFEGPERDFFPVPTSVRRVALPMVRWGPLGGISANLRRLRLLRKALAQLSPDVVVGLIHQVAVLTVRAARPLGIPAIAAERNHPAHYALSRPWRLAQRLTYPKAAAVVVQTEGIRQWAEEFVPRNKVRVIPNPVQVPPGDAGLRGQTIVAMGRLVAQKGFDILLEAFARAGRDRPGWRLVILGEGPERERLERQTVSLGIADRVEMPGADPEPHRVLRSAGLFVLSSRFEGFPNALLEALACGTPSVSIDCSTGPAEILEHGRNGLLVPPADPGALGEAMGRLMDDQGLRARLGAQASLVARRYATPTIARQWTDLFARVTGDE